MSPTRRRAAIAALTITLAGTLAPAAGAPPGGSLQGLVLTGGCPGQAGVLKNVILTPRTPWLFAPLRVIGPDFTPTRTWLFPYSVQVSGEGLKARHLTPGVVYTRPGRPPKDMITCVFEGATKEDGPFTVQITGPVHGR